MAHYGMETTVPGSVETVKSRVVEALRGQGFGILTEIDVQATFREKLGVEMEPYLLLGACNPTFAYQALSADPAIGLLLPCNVVLREAGGDVQVLIFDPEVMFSIVEEPLQQSLADLPGEVKRRLSEVLASLTAP
jgi:uncharacterized protein (DUF302 family)